MGITIPSLCCLSLCPHKLHGRHYITNEVASVILVLSSFICIHVGWRYYCVVKLMHVNNPALPIQPGCGWKRLVSSSPWDSVYYDIQRIVGGALGLWGAREELTQDENSSV